MNRSPRTAWLSPVILALSVLGPAVLRLPAWPAAAPGFPPPAAAAAIPQGKKEKKKDPAEEAFEAQKEKFEQEMGKMAIERQDTILGFGDIDYSRTIPFLIGLFDSESEPFIRGAVVRALAKRGTQEAVAAIIQKGIPLLIEDVNFYYVEEALKYSFKPDAEKWLLRNGLSPAVRKSPRALKALIAAFVVFKSPERFKVLAAELRASRDPELQRAILTAFRDSKPDIAAAEASRFIASRDVQVQIAALEVLLVTGAKRYGDMFPRFLKSGEWKVRVLAVDLVAMVKNPRLVAMVKPLLEDPDDRVKIAAIEALASMALPEVIEPLMQALGNASGRVQDDLVDALTRLTGIDLGPSPAQWESWWAINKGKVEIQLRSRKELARLRESTEQPAEQRTLLYHGLRVLSQNCAFIIDCSESMQEVYVVKKGEEEGKEGSPGKTVVRDPSKKKKADANKASKMEVAKKELLKVITGLKDGIRVNIIRFNSLVSPWRPGLEKLAAKVREDASKFVQAAKPEGLTNIYGSLEAAFQDENVDTIYLLSDGAPTLGKHVQPNDILAAVAVMNRLRKVKINTIGFNLKPNEKELLEKLAEENFGVFISR